MLHSADMLEDVNTRLAARLSTAIQATAAAVAVGQERRAALLLMAVAACAAGCRPADMTQMTLLA
jgi:hypothetical protein